jgi:hypothetical protein
MSIVLFGYWHVVSFFLVLKLISPHNTAKTNVPGFSDYILSTKFKHTYLVIRIVTSFEGKED